MPTTKLGPADFALQTILYAWFDLLKTDTQAWDNALYKFPDEVVAKAREDFLDEKRPVQVISGFPIADDRPPLIAIVMLDEQDDTEYMGQMEGAYQPETGDPVLQIGNITKPMIGIMVVSDDRRNFPQVLGELVKTGCLIAQNLMIEAGFIDLKFVGAQNLMPQEYFLPQQWWVRSYTYQVTEENLAQVPIDSTLWTPSFVKIALQSILNKEPSNDGGVIPRT